MLLFHNPFMKINVEHLGQSIYIEKYNLLLSFIIFLEGFLLIYVSVINGFMKTLLQGSWEESIDQSIIV